MCILKKLFRKFKREEKKEPECWYNNFHEQKKSRWNVPVPDEGALSSDNSFYYSTAQQAAKHQG